MRETPNIETRLSPCRRIFPPVLALSIIICIVYSNALDAGWQLDDITNIVNNEGLHLEALSLQDMKRALFSDPGRPGGGLYRPVACLTFALNHYVGGLEVAGYHLMNTAIHIMASLFLYLLIYQTLSLPSLSEKYSSQAHSIALLSATLWAIHPIQTQAVTYIVQRMTSLAGMFYVMSMYFYAKCRISRSNREKGLFLSGCLISFLLSFGSKENALLLPVSLLLYEILLVQMAPVDFLRRNFLKLLVLALAITLVGLLFLYFRKGESFGFLRDYEARPFSLTERLLTEPRVILFYVSLLWYPISERFSVAHSFPISTSLIDPLSTLPSLLAIAGSLAFLIILAKKNPLISFSFLFFFLNHLIESSVFALELVFEHRNYIPSIFFFIPIALGLNKAIGSSAKKGMRYLFLVFTLFLIIGLGVSTFSRNFVWKNTRTLWTDALQKAPDQMRVHHNLGFSYQETGDLDKAIYHFEKALKSPEVHRKDEAFATLYHLGKVYSEKGDGEKAKFWYLKAIRMKPDFSPALANLAVLYEEEGQWDVAARYTMQALKMDPSGGLTNLNTGIYLLRNGMAEAAIPHLKIALKEKATKGRALLHLGVAHKQKGEYGTAVLHLKNCLDLDPGNLTPRLHLAEIYIASGHEGKAQEEARRIAGIIARDPRILGQVADLISNNAQQRGTVVQGEILRPLLLNVLTQESEKIKGVSEALKKEMEK